MRAALRSFLAPFYWAILNRLRQHSVQSRSVGLRTKIGRHVIIRAGAEVSPAVEIGDYSYISGPRSYVEAARIGKYCSIARATTIGVSGHTLHFVTTHPIIIDPSYGFVPTAFPEEQKPAPEIGHDVWIGMGSFVMRGVRIGHGAVVAANSVVTRDVAPYSVVAGNPARHIKYRFDEDIIAALLKIQWWNWPEQDVKAAAADFYDIAAFVRKYSPQAR